MILMLQKLNLHTINYYINENVKITSGYIKSILNTTDKREIRQKNLCDM